MRARCSERMTLFMALTILLHSHSEWKSTSFSASSPQAILEPPNSSIVLPKLDAAKIFDARKFVAEEGSRFSNVTLINENQQIQPDIEVHSFY